MQRAEEKQSASNNISLTITYSAEVWGLLIDTDPTEKVHLYACKRFLNVAAHTPNKMVYGELGRHPLKINCFAKAVKFWCRLLHMDATRISYQAYRMLVSPDISGQRWKVQLGDKAETTVA